MAAIVVAGATSKIYTLDLLDSTVTTAAGIPTTGVPSTNGATAQTVGA